MVDALGTSVEVDEVDGDHDPGAQRRRCWGEASRFVKRCFDLVASTALMVLFAPVMLVATIAIRLDSRGPALFKQRRIGKAGRPFTLDQAANDGPGAPSMGGTR